MVPGESSGGQEQDGEGQGRGEGFHFVSPSVRKDISISTRSTAEWRVHPPFRLETKKAPELAGAFQLQAVFAGDGGKNCLGKLKYRYRNAEFQVSREGALVKPSTPRSGMSGRCRPGHS